MFLRSEHRFPVRDVAVLAGLAGLLWVIPSLTSEGQEAARGPAVVDGAVMPADVAALARADALALALAEAPQQEMLAGR